MSKNIFFQYDGVTGEYIGKRTTNKWFPAWSEGIVGKRADDLPQEVKEHPEHYKLEKTKLKELSKKDKEKVDKGKNDISVKI